MNVKESPLTILSASAREETEMRIVHNFLFLCMENNRNKTCMSVEYYCVYLLKLMVGVGGGIYKQRVWKKKEYCNEKVIGYAWICKLTQPIINLNIKTFSFTV